MSSTFEIASCLPVVAVMLPLVGSPVAYFVGLRWGSLRNWLCCTLTAGSLALCLAMYPDIAGGRVLVARAAVLLPLGISFRVDVLGFLLATVSAAIWFLATLYSLEYMRGEHGVNRYYAFLVLTLAGSLGTFLAGDLLTLFIFFELMSLPAAVLVIHEETQEAVRAALKYLFMTIGGSLFFFFSMVATYQFAGSVALGGRGLVGEASTLAFFTFMGFVVAFGIKAGMVPLHVWLPDAHPVAPSPASALLSGVMIKTGAYGMLRVMYEIFGLDLLRQTGWPSVMLGLSVITILLGSMVAVTQFDLKRRLAYSSVGQMGCILLGMSLMSERALTGDVFHFFADAVAKSCLFLCAGVIMKETGKRDIRQFGGIGHRLPITMACFAIAAFTLVGIPPFNGFISKLQLSLGAFDAGMPGYALALLASSMLNAVYYLPIVITAFFDRGAPAAANGAGRRRLAEAHPTMLAPIVVLALGCAVFALSSENWPLRLSETAARLLLGR